MQNLEMFTEQLITNPELYDTYDTFYIRMRNADPKTKKTYNKIKNALMSYCFRFDRSVFVQATLCPHEEVFAIGDVVAKLTMVGAQLRIHLKMDPSKQSTREAMFKVSDEQMIVYKLEKSNAVEQAVKAVRKLMASNNYIASLDAEHEDYASFYTQNVAEIADVVEESQQEYNRNVAPQAAELAPTADYGDFYDDENGSRSVDAQFIEVPSAMPTEDELRRAERERKERRKNAKKVYIWDELADYGYDFIWLKYLEFYLVTILVGVGLGIAYQLKWFWMLVLIVGFMLMMPSIIKSYYRNKYEEKRYDDVTTYIEQMLYSFRKNSKIIASLRDALAVFPTGKMHDTIAAALHAAQAAPAGTNIYEEAFRVVEQEYPCRRVRSLHRYMMKVEGVGGNHDAGIDALLKDRRLWVERIDGFKKEAATVLTDIYISIGFSVGLSCLVVRMMSTPLVDIPSNLFYQISSVVFLLCCALTILLATKGTILSLNDGEDEENSRRIIVKMNWIRNYDAHKELMKSLKMAAIFVVFLIVGFIIKNIAVIVCAAVALCYAIFLKRFMDKRSAVKSVCRAIEKVYPDWLLELALLLQIDNLHVAIDKTLDAAPLILRGDLTKLNEEIIRNPNSIQPFANFFDFLPLPQVQSSMKLLYSIAEFEQKKSDTQLMELVERNSLLMDKAEKYRNDDRLSTTFVVKFIPMGISSVKLMSDLVVLLVSYMGILTTAM